MTQDTIAAIATAMSNSGIGIVRISGSMAIDIADKIYRSKSGRKLADANSHTVHYGFIYDADELIDEVMVLVLKAPNSYTTEDSVEIDCHGGILVVKKILETVIKYGARCAEPGEFTKRAFLNGRIDLSQAEAVMDVIHSKNEFALRNSMNQLKGDVYRKIKQIRETVLYHIAFIESALDDPEHISLEGYQEEILSVVEKLLQETGRVLSSADDGKLLQEGIKTVIIGKPNAGKSSLMNFLAGEEKAIVTEIAGTTRDIIEEHIQLHGIMLNIVDTAGIRDTDDIVEKIGVDRALQSAGEADLIIYVVDSSTPLDKNDEQILSMLQGRRAVILLNKTDLEMKVTKDMLKEYTDYEVIPVSVKEEIGMDQLEAAVKDMFISGDLNFNDEVFITNVRQKAYIQKAYESLELVRESVMKGMPEDFYSIDLMSCYEALGAVIGESVEDDLVDQIFSKFCMGK